MSGKTHTSSPAKGGQQAGQDDNSGKSEQPGEQPTWRGGGNEPIHPDDIGDDGESLGRKHITRPTRSDDN